MWRGIFRLTSFPRSSSSRRHSIRSHLCICVLHSGRSIIWTTIRLAVIKGRLAPIYTDYSDSWQQSMWADCDTVEFAELHSVFISLSGCHVSWLDWMLWNCLTSSIIMLFLVWQCISLFVCFSSDLFSLFLSSPQPRHSSYLCLSTQPFKEDSCPLRTSFSLVRQCKTLLSPRGNFRYNQQCYNKENTINKTHTHSEGEQVEPGLIADT